MREEREIASFQTSYKRTKVNFYKNMAKNYYRKEFSRDKLEGGGPNAARNKLEDDNSNASRERMNPIEQLKSYRIKTSMGFRPFNSITPNASFFQTSHSTFFRAKHDSMANSQLSPNDSRLNSSNVDGLGLMANPFEVKLKKKKKS